MTSAFDSWADFFAMGGYAFYVWLALAMTLIPLAVLAGYTVLQHRMILRAVAQQHTREARRQAQRNNRGHHEFET